MSLNSGQIKNILVVRNDRFGEFLLTLPAFRALKETFTNARLIAAVSLHTQELAECLPFIDETLVWETKEHSLAEKLHLAKVLRSKSIDMAVIFNPSREFNIVAFLAGIRQRIGYARKWPFLLSVKIPDQKHLADKHEVEYNLELAAAAGAKTGDKSLFLEIGQDSNERLLRAHGLKPEDKIVALHPFTSDPVKQWPLERFAELARRIVDEPGQKVVVIGGRAECEKSRQLFGQGMRDRIINLAGLTTLKELAGVLGQCKVLVSGDSGPVHLACCVKTPVIALFRNDLPGKTARRWGPWGDGNVVIEKDSLEKISVEEVLEKLKNKLI